MPRDPGSISDAALRLALTPGLGPVTLRRLRAHFGDDETILEAPAAALTRVDGIGHKTADALRRAMREVDVDGERAALHEHRAQMLFLGDEDYPALLAAIPDPPPALWVKGTMPLANALCVAVVGSRRCTPYGREQAGRFASMLAECGMTIVSGGALGVDGEAHRGALRSKGDTVVVLGCGLSQAYPPQHTDLFARVVGSGGAIISEFPMSAEPRREHFPRRNRIISGLSLGVLVIEAARGSGALITAKLAAEEHGREVMAVPGRVDSPASEGCLSAIVEGWAAVVRHHADVLQQLDASHNLVRGALAQSTGVATSSASLFDRSLSPGQERIVGALRESRETLLIDQVSARTGLPLSTIMPDITLLEIRGLVERHGQGVRAKAR